MSDDNNDMDPIDVEAFVVAATPAPVIDASNYQQHMAAMPRPMTPVINGMPAYGAETASADRAITTRDAAIGFGAFLLGWLFGSLRR